MITDSDFGGRGHVDIASICQVRSELCDFAFYREFGLIEIGSTGVIFISSRLIPEVIIIVLGRRKFEG